MTVQNLKWPEMILFDYGQTLMDEKTFNGVKGTAACMEYAVTNPYQKTAEELQEAYDELNRQLGRFDPAKRYLQQIEVTCEASNNYVYGGYGITFSKSQRELEKLFWDTAAPAEPTTGVTEFLGYLRRQGVRTGVISNLSFCGEVLAERLREAFPDHEFEMVMASSDYVFRKPNPNIFRLALQKAGLSAEQVWYVGDHLQCDIVGADGAGLQPVWYTGALDTIQPMPDAELMEKTLRVEKWTELGAVMEKIRMRG